jgi:hypothetical protein
VPNKHSTLEGRRWLALAGACRTISSMLATGDPASVGGMGELTISASLVLFLSQSDDSSVFGAGSPASRGTTSSAH